MGISPRFNPLDPDVIEDPYPTYAKLRQSGRTARGGIGQVVVTRYKDVSSLLRSNDLTNVFPEHYRHFSVGSGPSSTFLENVLLHKDPPNHSTIRRTLSVPFSRSHLGALKMDIKDTVTHLFENAIQKGTFNAVEDLALPLPLITICNMMGLAYEDVTLVKPHGLALSRAFKIDITEEDRRASDNAVSFLREYFRELIANATDENLALPLIDAARNHDVDQLDCLIDNLIFLLFAGFETTSSLISNGLAQLMKVPSLFATLTDRPDLIPSFIEETLRYDAPIQSRARIVVKPIKLGEKLIPAGRVVLLLIGSANRDQTVYDRPDEFNIFRQEKPHLSFGGGIHHCLGAQLARLEAAAIFQEFTTSETKFYLNGELVKNLASTFRTYKYIPLSTG